ncbi:serine/threonine-specific protein kinase NAK [Capsaspora owczarzaki ATCC 30864]|uniref:TKL/IRAK protein kinase n=1 Tax=Capsaspora owczarzaki (strain ATCC 30864) TaxID=595528 RepID=A0A0D2WIM8_CAPO3|nr:serine/threonine-specific protein kinase NAK [Capsaspora owczarzaki ATCC 30864]KJE89715.1 TKL/IRAK protein kinase [Capsaspora owczarzaki ATCC 30864]|eukprot:XP_004366017.1 serine/threonine-specific protein kinase NAK [Capsaspora owczarzaki ATCC 30864]
MSAIPGLVTISRDRVQALLNTYIQYDGAFLVRPSQSNPGAYSIGVISKGAIKHFKIHVDDSNQVYIAKKKFSSVSELVIHYMQHPIRTNKSDDPVILRLPISTDHASANRNALLVQQTTAARERPIAAEPQHINKPPPVPPPVHRPASSKPPPIPPPVHRPSSSSSNDGGTMRLSGGIAPPRTPLEQPQQTTTAPPIIPRVSLQVLSQATAQFSEAKRIGGGGFGSVYSGVWNRHQVAVKRMAADSMQGVAQFEAELNALSRFRHPNIVTIMCYAQEGNERCLVYELMANGSVRDRLDRKEGTLALSWQQRRTIATDIANAMHFVQTAIPRQPLFHLDLKTDNVLLDADFHAKVADFGLTRSVPAQVDAHSYIRTQTVQGTLQYICPQYRDEGKVSIKTDVYSYGMILLELVTGQQPSIDLMASVRHQLKRNRKIDAVLDKAIDWSIPDKEAAQALAELAEDCLEQARVYRPSFEDILHRLSGGGAGANEEEAEEAVAGSQRECLVCFSAPTNAQLMPCYHACVCVACAQWMIQRQDKCMICRVLSTSYREGTFTETFVR